MPVKAIRSARSRRDDDKSVAILQKVLTAPPDFKVAAPPGTWLFHLYFEISFNLRSQILVPLQLRFNI